MNDLIYRQAAIDAVTKSGLQMERNKIYTMALVEAKQWAVDEIERLPSAQPERKKGKWMPSVDRWGDTVTTVEGYTCSNCDSFNADKDRFCPNCGADMRGEHEIDK